MCGFLEGEKSGSKTRCSHFIALGVPFDIPVSVQRPHVLAFFVGPLRLQRVKLSVQTDGLGGEGLQSLLSPQHPQGYPRSWCRHWDLDKTNCASRPRIERESLPLPLGLDSCLDAI